MLRQRLNRQLEASLEVCVRCGLCADSCHYYVANPKPEHVPAYRAEQVRKIYRQLFDPLAKVSPGWIGAAKLDQEMIEKLIYVCLWHLHDVRAMRDQLPNGRGYTPHHPDRAGNADRNRYDPRRFEGNRERPPATSGIIWA